MPAPVPITLDTLELALNWSSSGTPFENEALLSRATGDLFFKSLHGDVEEELPDDIEDGTAYITVPHKNDFDLGRKLVFAFARKQAPVHEAAIKACFNQRGAYAKFKTLLERAELLEQWYEYEAAATKAALTAWAEEHGFVIEASQSGA